MPSDESVSAAPPLEADVAAVLGDPAALWDAVRGYAGEYIAIVDRHGIIRFCNRVEPDVRLDDIVGHNVARFTVPESSERLLRLLAEVFTHGVERTLETEAHLPNGSVNYFSLRMGPLWSAGRVVAVMAFAESIRPLKASEQALVRERIVLRRLIEIQEKERQLVSYDIHDGLAQYIAGAIMHFEAHIHSYGGREPWEAVEGMRLLRAAAEESRRLIGGLRPPALDELGIAEAIESLVADAKLEIPKVTFTHDLPGDRLPPALETVIFRVVQESLTNARQHADARSATVVVDQVPGGVRVRVADDGRGFDTTTVPEERFGLEGIRQRCRLAGGEPRIESAPGKGTAIEVVLPLIEAAG